MSSKPNKEKENIEGMNKDIPGQSRQPQQGQPGQQQPGQPQQKDDQLGQQGDRANEQKSGQR